MTMHNNLCQFDLLCPCEVEQLRQLGMTPGGVEHGNVMNKAACGSLVEKSLAIRTAQHYGLSVFGTRWLRASGMDPAPMTVIEPTQEEE